MGEPTPPILPDDSDDRRISRSDVPPIHRYTRREKIRVWIRATVAIGAGLAVVVFLVFNDVL